MADFKAEILNGFVQEHSIQSVVEFGSGDGNQLSLATYPHYRGYDISPSAVGKCQARFEGDSAKSFAVVDEYDGAFDLSLSLDVLYHLVEDDAFETYLHRLFAASRRYVILYSTNREAEYTGNHIRHRCFTQ